MVQAQLVDRGQAVARRVIFEGKIRKVVDYFGGASPNGPVQAYLIEQKNYVSPAHLHPVDQFQVLYGAPGSLFARRQLPALTVHYADAYTIYGPLVGADPPLRYFTLRADPTDVLTTMPEARDLVPDRPGRSLHRDIELGAPIAPQPSVALLVDDGEEGLGISCLTGGPGARITVPHAGPVGQFLLVVDGSIEVGGVSYGPESVGWQPSGAGEWAASAGGDGLRLLVLRFPRRSARAVAA